MELYTYRSKVIIYKYATLGVPSSNVALQVFEGFFKNLLPAVGRGDLEKM